MHGFTGAQICLNRCINLSWRLSNAPAHAHIQTSDDRDVIFHAKSILIQNQTHAVTKAK